jgi:hypothetical protein
MIPQEIITHANTPGLAITFGSADVQLQPKIGRAIAVKTEAEGKTISFITPRGFFESHKSNLQNKGMISLTLTYPPTHKSIQFKGNCLEWTEASADDKSLGESSIRAFHGILTQFFGEEPANHFLKYSVNDLVHVKMTVNEIYNQTPGPGSGKMIYPTTN